MAEQSDQFVVRTFPHAFAEEFFYFEHRWVVRQVRIEDSPNAALAGLFPSFDPIAHVDSAIETEIDVGAEKAADEFAFVEGFEACAFGTQGEGIDEAVRTAAKIAEEKMLVVARGQAGSGVISHASGPGGDVRDRWQVKGGGVRGSHAPEHFRIPSAHLWQPLPAHAPTVVRTLYDVLPTGLIAAVAVVVAGEQITELVEGELLWIAEADGDDFQLRAVRLAAKDCAGIGERLHGESGPVIANFVPEIGRRAAVSNGEGDSAVR